MLSLLAALALQAPPVAHLVMPPSLHQVSDTGAVLLFETDLAVAASVRYRAGAKAPEVAIDEAEPTTLHRITLSNLPAATEIAYRLGGVAEESKSHFTTAPAPKAQVPVRFVVVGDSRDHAEWARIAEAVRQAKPQFILVTGDSVTGHFVDSKPDWREYYRAAASLFATTPVYAVPGNHDLGDQFALYNPDKGKGDVYSFTWGPAAFIALDSNHPDANLIWLARELGTFKGQPLFVFQHHPPYSCGVHGSSPKLQSNWGKLFSDAKVAIDFAGHDHDLIDWGAVDGVHYTVSGGGGTVLYPLRDCGDHFAQSSYGFALVDVDQGQVTERFYDGIGALLSTDGPFAAGK